MSQRQQLKPEHITYSMSFICTLTHMRAEYCSQTELYTAQPVQSMVSYMYFKKINLLSKPLLHSDGYPSGV